MAAARPNDLLLGFYGDDFTGSTDAMEGLTRAGLRTVLFIGRPRIEQLCQYQGLRAIGLAGCSRSLPPREMEVELGEAFGALKQLNLPIMHYKICSTFDSSPQIGSIGRALDVGARIFDAPVVPLLVGAPILGRYSVFGNLFARSGLDSEPYRLDRHPTMSRHPITPMTESDLRLHLARQTHRKIGLLDILSLADAEQARAKYRELVAGGAEVILLDILYREHEPVIGNLLWDQVREGSTLFIVGSSGVEYALTGYWKSRGLLPASPPLSAPAVEALIAISGSCSPVTDRQIGWALQQGAAEIRLETADLVDPATAEAAIEASVAEALKLHERGRTVICHSARGPADPRLQETVRRFEAMGRDARHHSGRVLGEALGTILLRVLERGKIKRVVIIGGDTSFFVARTLNIEALEMVAPTAPGCPLCRAYVPGSVLNGMEICFKGGQVGKDDFFGTVLVPSRSNVEA
ncbi:MAG TPA: four-carbon acid sugar kinase family protein [Phycisphaerae bacterium]|nr:four-carbon acid sugar kinase family protein [Phycisphaerae bacterium]HRR84228.1 four-carbon acid sugar kinase family protein [Phycisphaerae bacterium]